ncbi:hypothetical protein TUBRATIS_000160 [Tubulinosema ratisbonensis]|uniref:Uncharacterized protein n=1 Tax=Tubulinosema ratisbonensis TaxID=291195 RepID=A0A437AQZ4_9MICR|nr:hypothetical protein TUBRATIS_000160 [Tubulinosema ratisbonensis]
MDRAAAFLCLMTAITTILLYFFPLPKHVINLPENKAKAGGGGGDTPEEKIMNLDKKIHFFQEVLGGKKEKATGHAEFGPLEGVPESDQMPDDEEKKEDKEKDEKEKNKEKDKSKEKDKNKEENLLFSEKSLYNQLIPLQQKKVKHSKGIKKVNQKNKEEKEFLNGIKHKY